MIAVLSRHGRLGEAPPPYKILGLLPDPEGGLSDITDLYLAAFKLLPAGKRVFIRTLLQINGWRHLPKTISARIPPQ